ncbi:hypothetical protein [Enterobacter ludwigii]
MALIHWFLWRRWRFTEYARGLKPEPFLSNALKVNMFGCNKYRVIWRDMKRIMNVAAAGKGE